MNEGYVQVLHSSTADGRHWLTSMTLPPLQLLPVAPNHCRVGSALIRALARRLDGDSAVGRLEVDGVVIDVALRPAPGEGDDDGSPLFLTPQPPADWRASYDEWIASVAALMGLDPPDPDLDGSGYDRALAEATRALAAKLPSLRARFLAGMDGLNLGFKFGLRTRRGGTEFVWLQPTDWSDAARISGILQSQPRDCKGYKLGQSIDVPADDLVDYAIGSESAGLVESGPTQRVAEDYGLILT